MTSQFQNMHVSQVILSDSSLISSRPLLIP
jgi:hypothetical protein